MQEITTTRNQYLEKKLCCTCYKELDLLLDSDILVDDDAFYEVYLDERLNKVISSFRLYTINKH